MTTYLTTGEQANTYFNLLDTKAFELYQGVARNEAMEYVMQFNKQMMNFKQRYDNQSLTYFEGLKIIKSVAAIREDILELMDSTYTSDNTCEYIKELHKAVKLGRQALIEKLGDLMQ